MGKFIDLTGKKFGRWTVLERDLNFTGHKVGAHWRCKCECGIIKTVRGADLKNGRSVSCGCYHKERAIEANKVFTESQVKLNHIWRAMLQRCENPQCRSYKNYGLRGITVCERWHDRELFKRDMESTYIPGLQLDRINNNKGYFPENCHWVTPLENSHNHRRNSFITVCGHKMVLSEFARVVGRDPSTIMNFLKKHRLDGDFVIDGGKYDNTDSVCEINNRLMEESPWEITENGKCLERRLIR